METKEEIITILANEKRVEKMVCNISHQDMSADLSDLSQMVYLILLEYDSDKIEELWQKGEINFFLARIIINQFRSSNSPFHITFRKFQELSTDITGLDWTNEE